MAILGNRKSHNINIKIKKRTLNNLRCYKSTFKFNDQKEYKRESFFIIVEEMKKKIGSVPVFTTLALAVIAIFGTRTISNPEIWRHISNGQAVANKAPQLAEKADPFCFTTSGDSWMSVTPLYDKIMFALVDSPATITIIHIILALGAFLLLIPTAKKWANSLSVAAALFLCGILFAPFFYPTPIFFGMFFFSLTFALLQLKLKPAIRWSALIVTQIIWTNFHPSFLLGPALCLLSILQTNRKTKSGKKESKDLMILAGATLFATVINPAGLKLHTYIIQHFNELLIPQAHIFISPFSVYFEQPAMRSLLTIMLLLGAGGLITLKKQLPPVLTTLAILGALMMIRSLYFTVPFVYFAFPFLALSLQAIGEATEQASEPLLGKNLPYLKKAAYIVLSVFLVLASWANFNNSTYARSGSASEFGFGFAEKITPNSIEEIVNHKDFPDEILNLPFDGAIKLQIPE